MAIRAICTSAIWRPGPSKNILLWFDLSDVPTDARVMDASVTLFRSKVDINVSLCAYAMRRGWGEYEATWKEAWTGDKWGADGALSSSVDYRDGCLTSALDDSGTSIDLVTWDVTSVMQEWLSGSLQNNGLVVRIAPASRAINTLPFYSREYSQQEYRPLLAFTYTRPTRTPTPSITPSPTATRAGRLMLPLVLRAK